MSDPRATLPDFPALYHAEYLALTPAQTAGIVARGRSWSAGDLLARGGALVFPHVPAADCAHHVAAAAHAVLDSGASKVLVVGILHAWTAEMTDARARAAAGDDIQHHPLRGLQGPDLPNSRDEWRMDHSLIGWRHIWDAVCDARNIRSRPTVREVYPFLAGPQPETLPNFDDVARWAADAAVVATADPFHHGLGYGATPTTARAWDDGGADLARRAIDTAHRLLTAGDYDGFLAHAVATRNDARDSAPFYRALRGRQLGEIMDLGWSDMVDYYKAPPPTWVVAALTAWRPD